MTISLSKVTGIYAHTGIVAGVDTHADTHHVAVVTATGARLGDRQLPATTADFALALAFVGSFGVIGLDGFEDTSS